MLRYRYNEQHLDNVTGKVCFHNLKMTDQSMYLVGYSASNFAGSSNVEQGSWTAEASKSRAASLFSMRRPPRVPGRCTLLLAVRKRQHQPQSWGGSHMFTTTSARRWVVVSLSALTAALAFSPSTAIAVKELFFEETA